MFTRIPVIARVAMGAGGAGLIALGALGATPVMAAADNGAAAAAPAHKHHDRQDGRQDRRQAGSVVFAAEAQVLKLSPDELRDRLRNGAKVSDLTKDRGMDRKQFGEAVADAAAPGLKDLVKDHKITDDQAQRIEKRLAAGHVPFWNGVHHHKVKS